MAEYIRPVRRPEAPVQKNRMAAEEIAKIFAPWSERKGEGTVGQGGRTQAQWVDNNRVIQQQLERMSSEDDMVKYLVQEQRYDPREAAETASQAGRGGLLKAEMWGVPNAAADEMLNMAVLLNSGYTDVKPGAFKGTDISAVSPEGRPLMVDAQMRTGVSPSWSIPVLGNAFTASEAFNDPHFTNATLGDFIDEMVDENPRAWGDKLLHDPALHREFFREDLDPGKRKDALISTRRSRRSYNPRSDNALGRAIQGPYNPQRGDSVDLVDLQALRTKMLNQTIGELQGQQITNVQGMNKGGFRLAVPDSVMKSLTNDVGKLDPEVVKALSAQPQVVRRRRY